MVLVNKTSIYYVIFILAIGAGIFGLLFLRSNPRQGAVLKGGGIEIPVTIADTEALRDQGLSDTVSLPKNVGMLFVFDTAGKYGFWMKDMNYPLDFIWLDEQMKIVDVTADIAASTYPTIFYPAVPVHYVLEVNAGFSTVHSLEIGQSFELIKN